MPDWKKIKAEYIRGGVSYRGLCDKYGVSFSTLKRIARQEKWTDLKRQSDHMVTTKIIESVAAQEAKKVDMIDTIADRMLQRIGELMDKPEITVNPSNMRQLSMTLKDIREIKGCKSELDRQEQLARIEKLRREAQQEEKQDKEIKVVFTNELDEYAD